MMWNFFNATPNVRLSASINSANCTPTRRVFPAAMSYRFKTLAPSPQSTTITFIGSFLRNSRTIFLTHSLWPLWVNPWIINLTFLEGSNVELVIEGLLSTLRTSLFLRAFALVYKMNFVPMVSGCDGKAIRELSNGWLSEKQPYLP